MAKQKLNFFVLLISAIEMESPQHNNYGEFKSVLKQTLSLISHIQHNLTTE